MNAYAVVDTGGRSLDETDDLCCGLRAARRLGRAGCSVQLIRSDTVILAIGTPLYGDDVHALIREAEQHNARVLGQPERRNRPERGRDNVDCVCGARHYEELPDGVLRCKGCRVYAHRNGGGQRLRVEIYRCMVCHEAATERVRTGWRLRYLCERDAGARR